MSDSSRPLNGLASSHLSINLKREYKLVSPSSDACVKIILSPSSFVNEVPEPSSVREMFPDSLLNLYAERKLFLSTTKLSITATFSVPLNMRAA